MRVVRVEREPVHAVGRHFGDVRLVRVQRVHVALDRVRVASHADVHVRGHVHDVPRARHERRQALGARHGALGVCRLHHMDVEVTCTGMPRRAAHDGRERRDRARAMGLGAPARQPEVPRSEQHLRLGVQHGRVVVRRIGAMQTRHRARIRRVERLPPRHRIGAEAHGERFDVRALARRRVRGERDSAADRRVRGDSRGGIHRDVDVRPQRERLSPAAHRARGIEPQREAEAADRIGMIERVHEAQPLIEVALTERAPRRDPMVMVAEPVPERDRIDGGSHSGACRRLLRAERRGEREDEQRAARDHPPSVSR